MRSSIYSLGHVSCVLKYHIRCLIPVPDTEMEMRSSAPLYSCLQPVDLAQHAPNLLDNSILNVSPAQGNKPVKALETEIDCFATKFSDGKNSFTEKRHIPIGIGHYINQRLYNINNKFASDPTYIFWAQYAKEITELSNCMSVAMRKKNLQTLSPSPLTC